MSKELIEELNEQVLTYDEWAREKCTEKLAIDRIEELERFIAMVFESTPPYREDGTCVFSESVIEKWKELLP